MQIVNIPAQDIAEPARNLAARINGQLEAGNTVVWLVSGGSALGIAVKARELLTIHGTLHIALIDERFGPAGHPDSNWQQLLDKHFDTSNVTVHPIIKNDDNMASTAEAYSKEIEKLLTEAGYTIGLFGMGRDGHTSGLLPKNPIMQNPGLYASYEAADYRRITSTPELIRRLDEAVLYAVGKEKWPAIAEFLLAGPIGDVPVRILKEVKQLTVYRDYKGGAS